MGTLQATKFVHSLVVITAALVLTGCTSEPPQPVIPTVQEYYRVFDQTLNSLTDAPSKHWLRQFTAIAPLCRDLGQLSDENSKQAQAIFLTTGLKALRPMADGYTVWIVTTASDSGVEVLLALWDINAKEQLWRKNSIAATDRRKASYNLQATMATAFSTAWLLANHPGVRKMPRLEAFLKM
jgi:hypothetical protein